MTLSVKIFLSLVSTSAHGFGAGPNTCATILKAKRMRALGSILLFLLLCCIASEKPVNQVQKRWVIRKVPQDQAFFPPTHATLRSIKELEYTGRADIQRPLQSLSSTTKAMLLTHLTGQRMVLSDDSITLWVKWEEKMNNFTEVRRYNLSRKDRNKLWRSVQKWQSRRKIKFAHY